MSDPIAVMARWLASTPPGTKISNLEWLRHRKEADEVFADIAACARVVAGIARGPAEQKYLGPCGAEVVVRDADGSVVDRWSACEGDVYGVRGGSRAHCRTCGAEVATAEREAWLDGEVRAHAFRAAHIADAHRINVNTIRSWAFRVRADTGEPALKSYYRTEAGLIAPWVDPPEGEKRERLHYVGDVLDLATADAVRRAEEQAKRARRAAQREEAA